VMRERRTSGERVYVTLVLVATRPLSLTVVRSFKRGKGWWLWTAG
jgi:hypothetical protein